MIWCLYQLVMQTKRIAVYIDNSTRLPYLHQSYVHLSQWIPCQTAAFIQDPYQHSQQHALLDPLLVIVHNEFYIVWVLPCPISYLVIYPATSVSSMLYHVLRGDYKHLKGSGKHRKEPGKTTRDRKGPQGTWMRWMRPVWRICVLSTIVSNC